MRHRVNKKTLNRTYDQRRALFTGMAADLIQNGKINTTLAKAKVIRPYVEKLVTRAVKASKSSDKIVKFNTLKLIRKHLRSELAIRKLLVDVAPKFENRAGGYTRIVKIGNRDGDNASLARIEFVENTSAKVEAKTEKKTTKKKIVKEEKKDEKNTK
ncbi:MAG: 50S ribosomal protein L17 [Patescibacteria group bacterium]|nr:50S ribosomal protein L17 [Patescibacteria group bacterium]MBU1953097.1 50S ribosomal protein L17 [Patescibacteria group bacterium]